MIEVIRVKKDSVMLAEIAVGKLPPHKVNEYVDHISDTFKESAFPLKCVFIATRADDTTLTVIETID